MPGHGSLRRSRRAALWAALALVAVGIGVLGRRYVGPVPLRPGESLDAPAPLAVWPWPQAARDQPHPGVTHWLDRSSPDGTVLDLLEFDFAADPRLRLELYDQDEDDAAPHDNAVDYWPRGVGQVTRHLNQTSRGAVVAAWNGLFFAFDHRGGGRGVARHVAPVVLGGKVYYNVGNHRWTFGVQQTAGGPVFKALHLPDRTTLAREFSYAAAGAQCLVREGRPLKLRPYPGPDEPQAHSPVPSTPEEAGHIPLVDFLKTSRTSMGWSRDQRRLYLLIVKEPDTETGSTEAFRRGLPVAGGWMLADLQRFWVAFGAWGAVNVDGGEVTQMAYLRPDGRYEMVPPRWACADQRRVFPPTFEGAPQGGTLMYFCVKSSTSAPRPIR